jgi:hypothetical protein
METIDLGNGAICEIDANGYKWWYLNGQLHRTDGPAVEWPSGNKSWCINGTYYSEEDFNVIKEVLWAL